MESPLIQEIYEEGKSNDKREVLLMLLQTKFGDLPQSINARIRRLRSEKAFNRLLKQVLTANSLGELGFK